MPISITARSFSVPITNRNSNQTDTSGIKVVNPSVSEQRQQENKSQIQQLKSLSTATSSPLKSSDKQLETANQESNNTNLDVENSANQRLTLTAEQSARLSLIRNEDKDTQQTNNLQVGQYINTANFERREEIETLVGVDIFV